MTEKIDISRLTFIIAHLDYAIDSLNTASALTAASDNTIGGTYTSEIDAMCIKLEDFREEIAGKLNDILGGEAIV